MAFQVADLYATIRADATQIQAAMPKLRAKLERVQVSMEKVSRVARRMFLGVAAIIGLTTKQASDAEEAHNKFMTVFRDEGVAVTKWAKDYGKAVGRAQVDMETYLGTIQDTLVPLGLARHEATKLSKEIVKLGLDLASFNNEADSNALDNLQSALVGQSRAVLKYGVVVNQSQIQQELLNMGIQRSYDLTTNQEKVQARLNIIFRSTTDAQGDLIRTQSSFENTLKATLSSLKDLSAQVGQAFIPAMVRMLRAVRNITGPLGEWVTQNMTLVTWIGGVTAATLGLLAILPLLITSLGVLAAHPVALALGAAAAAIALMTLRMEALNAAIRTTASLGTSANMTLEALRNKLHGVQMQAEATKGELDNMGDTVPGMKERMQTLMDGPAGAVKLIRGIVARFLGKRTLQSELAGYKADLKAIQALIDAIDEAPTPPPTGGLILPTEAEHKKLDDALRQIELDQKTAHQRRLIEIEEEMNARLRAAKKAMATDKEILAIADEANRKMVEADKAHFDAMERDMALQDKMAELEEKRLDAEAEDRVRKREGAMGGRAAFTGLADLNRRIQEAVFNKAEQQAQARRHKEMVEIVKAEAADAKRTADTLQRVEKKLGAGLYST